MEEVETYCEGGFRLSLYRGPLGWYLFYWQEPLLVCVVQLADCQQALDGFDGAITKFRQLREQQRARMN
jgi:hypothetical protein